MGGFFGVASKEDCVADLFYGTDYHSHLGTTRGGMAVWNGEGFTRFIHDITNAQFRSKFDNDIGRMKGHVGIGVISDFEDQPLIIGSHLGNYAIVTVGLINNRHDLAKQAFSKRTTHFSEMSGDGINPTELVATLINQEATFEDGIRAAQDAVDGSCSILLLTEKGLYAARDKLGRTPIVTAKRPGAFAATFETAALANLGFEVDRYLGPGEIALITPEGVEQRVGPHERMQICAFLWVYFGYPASSYEDINVEAARNRCGACLARREDVEVDAVSGIPDSGTGHAIGFASEAKLRYLRPFVKYTPTWPRSFMPQEQRIRDLVAKMKLIPIPELTQGMRLLFVEDSIVRGTQLKDTIQRIYDAGAKEVHMRPACPPLMFGCKFLNFSRSSSVYDLAARRAIREMEGDRDVDFAEYVREGSDKHKAMVERIGKRLNLNTLRYQRMADMVKAIGLPKEKLCTYCWDAVEWGDNMLPFGAEARPAGKGKGK